MASPTRWSSTYRCPNVPAEIPLDLAFCNYTDCTGCSSQRAIRMADVPDPDPSLDFDDRDREDIAYTRDAFTDPFDGAFDGARSEM